MSVVCFQDERPVIRELLLTIARHTPFPVEDIWMVYQRRYSIDRVLNTITLSCSFNISLEQASQILEEI